MKPTVPRSKQTPEQDDGSPKKPLGYMAKQVLETPAERMPEMTFIPRNQSTPLACLVTNEQLWREMIDHQYELAGCSNEVADGEEHPANPIPEYDLPSEILRFSMYQHNRSIEGEHLDAARGMVEGELAAEQAETGDPHDQ